MCNKKLRLAVVSQIRIENPRVLHGKIISECKSLASLLDFCMLICLNRLNRVINLVIPLENGRRLEIISIPTGIDDKKDILGLLLEYLKMQLKLLIKLILLIKERKINLIRVENIFLLGLPVFISSKLTGVKYISWLGGNELNAIQYKMMLRNSLIWTIIKIIYKICGLLVVSGAKIIIVLSKDLSEIAQSFKAKEIVHIYNYVDLQKFKPAYKSSQNIKRLLYVGRLSYEKGIFVLLEAFKKIADEMKEIELWIIGDGILRERVKKFIISNNLSRRVKLFGLRSHDEMPFIYAQASVFVLPSFTESCPASLLEAMASGLIVIANDVGCIHEIIMDGIDGFIISKDKIGDPNFLKEKIKQVFAIDPIDRVRIRENARNKVECISKNFLEKTLQIYMKI
ncbi:MAG: glycosyltransferase family 4 protein [Candidatus Aenigmatarchaeota archaeon]